MSARISVWGDPKRRETLRKLWDKGHTTLVIARHLKCTKSSVIGAAHRMGLKSRPSPIKRLEGAESKPTARPYRVRVKHTLAVVKQTGGSSLAVDVTSTDLTSTEPFEETPSGAIETTAPPSPQRYVLKGECAWPVKATTFGRWVFCCAAVEGRKPYCSAHCDVAYARRRAGSFLRSDEISP